MKKYSNNEVQKMKRKLLGIILSAVLLTTTVLQVAEVLRQKMTERLQLQMFPMTQPENFIHHIMSFLQSIGKKKQVKMLKLLNLMVVLVSKLLRLQMVLMQM